jgi:hypothetical protein
MKKLRKNLKINACLASSFFYLKLFNKLLGIVEQSHYLSFEMEL